ncbi:TadE/TadG family type IV pilus assembly protein [Qipengyuania zhejiangensis]|uniref:TadE/TadG family type IV pilus assembly protein n=1 Tax=Qipengyuania zhejiangensis TaxID=3077782 RepID=UPI002D7A318C|nr:pilus assembly protein TadG-related protein [Qipengyuania sp. Z2]
MIGSIARMLRRLRGDDRGNLLLMAGAALTGLVGAAGIGVDTVQWYLWKRQMQQAVDTGAVAGAIAMAYGRDHSISVNSEVSRTANTAYTIEAINTPPTSGAYLGDASAIEVIATTSQTLPFSSVFLPTAPTIRTRAVATTVAVGTPCVLAVATSGTGIEVFGGAQVGLDCPVASNSPGGVSVDVGGSSYLDSDLIMSVGGIDYGSENIPGDAAIVPYGLPVEDPLANRPLPYSSTGCVANNYNVNPNSYAEPTPGTYCNGMRIQGTVKLHGGVYVIKGGTLAITSQADVSLYGDGGVTFVLTGTNANNVATISINGGAEIDLRAPTSEENATWSGILFYQDPMGAATHTVNGGSDINLEGIIYMPTGDLTYNGDSTQEAQCLLIVTERIRFGGTNNIENNCNPDINGWQGTARVIRVVE